MAGNETTLFVGNLPFSASPAELNELFSQAGSVVSVHIPTDRETGRSRGFGFIEMDAADEMEQAISMFNGYSLDGRALVVNQARPREDRR
jgi:cold-inducible RNA-binding protein